MMRLGWKMRRRFTRLRALRAELRRNDSGTTAIEFAILGLPFFVILFGIIELAVVFFLSTVLSYATNEAGREIRTGQFCGTSAEFKEMVCENMVGIGRCEEKVAIDVVSSDSGFAGATLPPPPSYDPDDPSQQMNVPPSSYEDTVGGDVVVIRAQYFHQLAMPGKLSKLSNAPQNHRRMVALTAFRNEPFPACTPPSSQPSNSGGST